MKNKRLFEFTKIDTLNFLLQNFIGIEFTVEDFIIKANKKGRAHAYPYGYEYYIIINHIRSLIDDKYLTVRYISQNPYVDKNIDLYIPKPHRRGTFTNAIYKLINLN